MYEVMLTWDDPATVVDEPPFVRDFAQLWQAAGKVVYSRTLESASSARTRVERDFVPDAVRRMKAASDRDITVGGPDVAGQAIRAGLVDELHLLVAPVVVGAGQRCLPAGVRLRLELLEQRRFAGGVVYLHYHIGT